MKETGSALATAGQTWERDLVNAINTTNKNIAFLRSRGDHTSPSFSEVIGHGESRLHRPNEVLESQRPSNYFELKARESLESSQGAGITRPLPKHIEDDLILRIGNAIKRSVDRTMHEKLSTWQSYLNQIQNQINTTDQHEARNRKLISSVIRSLPEHEQNVKAVANEVEQLKEITDRLQSDTNAMKVWKDLVDSNLKNIRQNMMDMGRTFTNTSDIQEAMEMIAKNIGNTFQRAMETIKLEVDRDFKEFRFDLSSNQQEIRQLADEIRTCKDQAANHPVIEREDLVALIEKTLHSDLSLLERRLTVDCEKFLMKSHDELRHANDRSVKEAAKAYIDTLFHNPDSSSSMTAFIHSQIESAVSEMVKAVSNENIECIILPNIAKELNYQLNNNKQGLQEDLVATLDTKLDEIKENLLKLDIKAAVVQEVKMQMNECMNASVDTMRSDLETLIAEAIVRNQAITAERSASTETKIENLRKQMVSDLYEVKAKMKVTQGLCQTVEESLSVVKSLDSQVGSIRLQQSIQADNLDKVHEVISSTKAGMHGTLGQLKVEFQEMMDANTRQKIKEVIECSVKSTEEKIYSNIDCIESTLSLIESHCHKLDRQVNNKFMHLESRIDKLYDMFNNIHRKEQTITQPVTESRAHQEKELSIGTFSTENRTSAPLLSECKLRNQEIYEEIVENQNFDQEPCPTQLLDVKLPYDSLVYSPRQIVTEAVSNNVDNASIRSDSRNAEGQMCARVMDDKVLDTPIGFNFSYEEFDGTIEQYDYIENVPYIHDRVYLQNFIDDGSDSEETVISDDFESESRTTSFEEECDSLPSLPSIRE